MDVTHTVSQDQRTSMTSRAIETSRAAPDKKLIYLIFSCTILALACAAPARSVETVHDPDMRQAQQAASTWDEDARLMASVDPYAFDAAAARAAIYYATNEQRRAHGMDALPHEPALDASSQLHAERMREYEFFAHEDPTSSTYRTPDDRARAVGVSNPRLAENIATQITLDYRSGEQVYGRIGGGKGKFSRTPDGPLIPPVSYARLGRDVVEGWMNSPGHRKNILHRDAVSLGAGAAFYWQGNFPAIYAVQNFQFFEPLQRSGE